MQLLRKKKKQRRDYASPKLRQIPTEEYFQIVREQLVSGGRATVRVTGVSMKPFLTPVRDTVEIIPPDDTIKPGDIALFDTHHGRYILHRITRFGENTFDMRGDNTVRGETNLPKDCLVGIVDSAMRNGRKISRKSLLFKVYAIFSPAHYTWAVCRNKVLRPLASWIYHTVKSK